MGVPLVFVVAVDIDFLALFFIDLFVLETVLVIGMVGGHDLYIACRIVGMRLVIDFRLMLEHGEFDVRVADFGPYSYPAGGLDRLTYDPATNDVIEDRRPGI